MSIWGSITKGLSVINPVAAIGTAAQMGGDLLAYQGQKDTNEANERIAAENRAFQERMVNSAQAYQDRVLDRAYDYQTEMSNTAYQRGMEDMREAGLNPILAYSQGGASTPIGQTAPGHTAAGSVATMNNPAGVFSGTAQRVGQLASTASTVMSQAQERENMQSKLMNDHYYRSLTQQQQVKVAYETERVQAEIRKITADTEGVEADNVQRKIVADFLESNEFVGIAKAIGVDPKVLGGIWRTFFGVKPLVNR